LKESGLLKGGKRKEKNWDKAQEFLREPYKEALDRFRDDVLRREDFDPSSPLQFGLFMSMGIINVLKEIEKKFGIEGQKAVNDALIKTGYDMGKQMIDPKKILTDISDIEIMSFLATIINTQAWTSIEEPTIDNEDECSFNILWCPLQDIYNAFDCRVQRYLVQGIIDYFRDNVFKSDFQIEFQSTIPAGAEFCRFIIKRKKPGEPDIWETYSRILEQRALKKMHEAKKNQ